MSKQLLQKTLAEIRPDLAAFSVIMEARMRAHDDDRGKKSWPGCPPEVLLEYLDEQVATLRKFILESYDPDGDGPSPAEKAADVANVAMMVADNWTYGDLDAYWPSLQGEEAPTGAVEVDELKGLWQWVGVVATTRHKIATHLASIPAGTEVLVVNRAPGLTVETRYCKSCGVAMRVAKLRPHDLVPQYRIFALRNGNDYRNQGFDMQGEWADYLEKRGR